MPTDSAAVRIAALSDDQRRLLDRLVRRETSRRAGDATAPPEISIMFFSSNADWGSESYELVIEAARLADRHGLHAIWLPERHFHQFGGLFPSPAVLAGSVAAQTERLQIRAGSVVAPLHHPMRVAEDWAVVDLLSRGRVGLSFASGWSPDDFVLAPESYASRRDLVFERAEEVSRIWRGDPFDDVVDGDRIVVRLLPTPIQAALRTWISSVGSRSTCERAGAGGHNLLTAMLRQSLAEASVNIAAYRFARDAAGHIAGTGVVTMMAHTYLGADAEVVRATARGPLTQYLSNYLDLAASLTKQLSIGDHELSHDDRMALAERATDRYLDTQGLIGSPTSVLPMVRGMQAAGVNEIACLLDFGLEPEQVLAGLTSLFELRDLLHSQVHLPVAPDLRSDVETAPTTRSQERLWFLDRLVAGTAAYNVRSAVRLEGELDASLLERCLNVVVARHDALRTSIESSAGRPIQRVLPVGFVKITTRAVSADSVEYEIAAEVNTPFELDRAPLMRATVLRVSRDDHVMLLTFHHVVADGWSVGVIQRELAELYAMARSDPTSDLSEVLPEVDRQYADYAREQDALAPNEPMSRQLAHWQEQLSGAPTSLELDVARPRPAVQTFVGELFSFELDAALAARLRSRSVELGITVFDVLLAAYGVVLSCASGERDLVIGTPMANRTRVEWESVVGLFVNMVPLRLRLHHDIDVASFLREVHRTNVDAQEHQACPLELIVESLSVDRDLTRQPLFQVALALQPRVGARDIGDLRMTPLRVRSDTSKFDLLLDVTEETGGLAGAWEFNTDLFEMADVAALHEDLLNALVALLGDEERSLSGLVQRIQRAREDRKRQRLRSLRDANSDLLASHSSRRRRGERFP